MIPTQYFSSATTLGAPSKPVEIKIPLWWASGQGDGVGGASSPTYLEQDGTTGFVNISGGVTSAARMHTLSSKWPSGTKFAFEVTLYTGNATSAANAQLYDVTGTSGTAISGSAVNTTSTTAVVLRSGQFTLTNGESYGFSVWPGGSYQAYLVDASLIVFP